MTFCCDVPNIDLLDANLAARKIGPHKGGSDRRERAFVGKRSDDGAAKIPPRFGRDDCREVHRDVVTRRGFSPPLACAPGRGFPPTASLFLHRRRRKTLRIPPLMSPSKKELAIRPVLFLVTRRGFEPRTP